MNPEDRTLLKQALRLSEENNEILQGLQRRARWSSIWGFIKLLIIVIPLVIGYFYFQPYFEQLWDAINEVRALLSPGSGMSR